MSVRPPRRALSRALALIAPVLLALALPLGLVAPAAAAPGAVPPYSVADARAGAEFFARLIAPDGGIASPPAGPTPSDRVGGTVQVVLTSSAVDPRRPEVARGLTFLRTRLDAYLRTGTPARDDPGRLAYAILAYRAAGADPHRAGTAGDLVARLRATQQRTGPDAGLYGTAAAFNGSFSQGLALAALRGVGVLDPAGVRWALRQQCPDGGFSFYRADPAAACTGDAAPDTNDTAFASQGLIAQGVPPVRAVGYLVRQQNPDGGFGFLAGSPSDGTSTADCLQAILAFRLDPTSPLFTRNRTDVVRALDGYQVRRDDPATPYDDRGAYSNTRTAAGPGPADPRFATTQAIPAAAGKAFPY